VLQLEAGAGGNGGDLVGNKPGIQATAEQGALPLFAGVEKWLCIRPAPELGIAVPVDADDIFARRQQAADIPVMVVIRRLDLGGVEHHVGFQCQYLLDVIGGYDPGGIATRNLSGVPPHLAVAVDKQPHQLQFRNIPDTFEVNFSQVAGTGYTTGGYPGDYNYVTNVNGTTVTIASAITAASTVNISFVGYPEVIVAWNAGNHAYTNSTGV